MHIPGHGDNHKAIKQIVGNSRPDVTGGKIHDKLERKLQREQKRSDTEDCSREQFVQSSTTGFVEDSLFNLHLAPQRASTNNSVGGGRVRLVCMTSEELDTKIKEKLMKRQQRRRKIKKAQYDANDDQKVVCSKKDGRDDRKREKLKRTSVGENVSSDKSAIELWHQKYDSKKALELVGRTSRIEWLSSFYKCDPRLQILTFFNEVARDGGIAAMDEISGASCRSLGARPLTNLFAKANIFTVWRPTSNEAIKNMMLGIATGKGLDIKGKSAKRGNISSYVPFIQIYEEHQKEKSRSLINEGKLVRVYYQSAWARNEVYEMLLDVKDYMQFAKEDAYRVLNNEDADPVEQSLAMKHLMVSALD